MSEPAPLSAPLPALVVGARLRLELWRADAVEPIHSLVERSRDSLAAFLPWAAGPVDADAEAAAQADAERRWGEARMAGWVIVEGGEPRGMIGLHRRGGPDEMEIGYWLDDAATGRGLMTEAVTMVVDLAFRLDGIELVEILHDAANHRSGAVPARLGFSRTAAFTSVARAPMETGIKVRWIVRRDEWLARRDASSVLATG